MMSSDPRLISIRDALIGQVLRGSGGVTYHVRECIGEGGQGWVYKANWDEPGGLVVIVKVLRPDAVHGEALRRFQREADTLRMLSQQARPNPHIVRFFDHAAVEMPMQLGSDRLSLPYTVLEYVHGPTLEKVLAQTPNRGIAVERVRRITRQVSLALDLVHAQKVVHRDLKPSNILLANEAGTEVAKVTDFGLVKLVDMNLHRTAALAGASLGYAPPEQYEQGNQRVSPRTDVFSLAAIVFEMLTGKGAFPYRDGENPLLIVTRILNGPRPQIVRHRDSLPAELATQTELIEQLDRQLARALSADPADRHESVREFFASIEPALKAAQEGRRSVPGSTPDSAVSPFVATEPAFRNSPSSLRNKGANAPVGSGPRTPLPASNPAMPVAAPAAVSTPPGNPGNQRPSERMRTPEAAAANPAAWSWNVVTRSLSPGTVRAAAFSPNGDLAFAAGPSGAARWERGQWTGFALPPQVDARALRGVAWGRDPRAAILLGEHGLALRMPVAGKAELWHIPDRELTFHGAHVDDNGLVTLVGERPARPNQPRVVPGNTIGALAQIAGERVTLIADAPSCTRLRAATRMMSGTLVACGEWGTLVRLEMGVVEHIGAICGGHLHAIVAVADGGAVTVGMGGHALYVNTRLEAQLEAVQTTRDLFALTIGEDGAAWAGSAQARLLRRCQSGWLRMSGDVGITPNVVAIWAGARAVRAVCDDGAVIEGKLG
jgi:eukaryotic-like serine/threonine-protein kinase